MYQKKTEDLYIVQQYTGKSWEDVSCSENRKEAKEDLKAYRENQPTYAVRLKKTRQSKEEEHHDQL